MIYLKQFESLNDYEAYAASENFIAPNVSYIPNLQEGEEVKYIKEVKNPTLTCTYKLNMGATTLNFFNLGAIGSGSGSGEGSDFIEQIVSMKIDGVEQPEIIEKKEYSDPGTHVVEFKLIPNAVISDNAFTKMNNLTDVVMSDGITSIGVAAFEDCGLLSSITISNTVTTINDRAFDQDRALTSVTIPNSVTILGFTVFGFCEGLTEIVMPSYLTSMGTSCFVDCHNLQSIVVPSGITEIKSDTFADCSSLTSVTIPNTLTKIGYKAFSGCSNLPSIDLPSGVTEIRDNAFTECDYLSQITCRAMVAPTISSGNKCPFYLTYENFSGTIFAPHGSSGYDVWVDPNEDYYIGKYEWRVEDIQ